MPVAIYGDGTLYGTADVYGRVAAGLVDAQAAHVRETALRISVIDERVNRWEFLTRGTVTHGRDDFKAINNDPSSIAYAFYRMQVDAVALPNGSIVRVRIGDGSLSDFQVYHQTITDPTDVTQWNTWSVLYSGTHYALAVANNGNTVHVYTSKSDGLYRDNSLMWAHTGIIFIEAVIGTFDALFVTTTGNDPFDPATLRRMQVYYTDDVTSTDPVYDQVNYRWYDSSMAAILLDDGTVLRYQSFPRYNPRSNNNGDSITVSKMLGIDDFGMPSAPRIIRGLAGEVGHNLLRSLVVTEKMTDGYYYLFYSEGHRDNDYEITESVGQSTNWQRSKDGIHWSEPTVSGTDLGRCLVEIGDWIYFPSYDGVYRRPSAPVVYEISNFVPTATFEIPRDNQEGSGSLTVANPAGVNDILLDLSDRRLKLEVGLRVATGEYEYTEFDDWWIKRAIQNVDGNANRISIEFGDIWTRLNSALRDTFNFVGQLKWNDWSAGNRNEAFNYFFVSDTAPSQDAVAHSLTTRGICLFTGWKGQNGTAQAHFSAVTGNPAFIFRYVDPKNYQRIEKQGTSLLFIDRVNGVETTVDSAACASDTSPVMKIELIWETYKAWVNGVLVLDGVYPDQPNVKPGYVGFKGTRYTITSFSFIDWEAVLNAEELVKTALAMGDYHDVVTGTSTSEELAIIWGPQTDNPTPADGLRNALEAVKWELVWSDSAIRVGQFKDTVITRILQDEIVKTDYVDEANRRINMASVDGNENTWIETDVVDTQLRDRQISAYFDLPELTDQDSVTNRAQEEVRRGQLGRTPGGQVPLIFDLQRMDPITWIDNSGKSTNVRVEGISVEIDQGLKPSQRETLDTSLLDAEV